MNEPREPLIHSHITDVLPDDHPLAETTVNCDRCGVTLHHCINECMATWLETGRGNYCLECWFVILHAESVNREYWDVLEDEWGLL